MQSVEGKKEHHKLSRLVRSVVTSSSSSSSSRALTHPTLQRRLEALGLVPVNRRACTLLVRLVVMMTMMLRVVNGSYLANQLLKLLLLCSLARSGNRTSRKNTADGKRRAKQ